MGRHSAESTPGSVPGSGSGQRPLEGARILITRSADRAEPLAAALRDLGAEPLVLPLIDFELASDQHSLDVAFDALGAGGYQWLVITSTTTLLALEIKAAERGTGLRHWVPGSVRVAAVGTRSRDALLAKGLQVDLLPEEDQQSAAGLLDIWPPDQGVVFLPQADIADPALARGLESRGARVQAVTAYRTVDYPADPGRSLAARMDSAAGNTGAGESGLPSPAALTPATAKIQLAQGRLHAVVVASPSAVERIHSALRPLGDCRLVAIGPSTAAQAESVGLPVTATANAPTTEGLVQAIIDALSTDT
ncbi:uroporphyrinogen-III synthase [Arthrobacter sp.]|uniref:uroporphyrinogen-III synthase n=1 Tax=Arthrobacter sp. TaxID=1667 RepID=UPI00281146DB|nr:uroporphyrinogen-III synthase [Arthrobacter sp.]